MEDYEYELLVLKLLNMRNWDQNLLFIKPYVVTMLVLELVLRDNLSCEHSFIEINGYKAFPPLNFQFDY